MILSDLVGAAIRHWDGRKGRIVEVNEDSTTLEWGLEGSSWITYEQIVLNSTIVSENRVEVLDIQNGWVPLSRYIDWDVGPLWSNSVLGESSDRSGSKHSPFQTKSTLSGGPLKKTKHKRGNWKCSCKNYRCRCKGKKGAEKTVKIKKKYKRWYNRVYLDYLQGRSGRKKRPAG